jgi:hypothetical protein
MLDQLRNSKRSGRRFEQLQKRKMIAYHLGWEATPRSACNSDLAMLPGPPETPMAPARRQRRRLIHNFSFLDDIRIGWTRRGRRRSGPAGVTQAISCRGRSVCPGALEQGTARGRRADCPGRQMLEPPAPAD